jgi:hypothetical protein
MLGAVQGRFVVMMLGLQMVRMRDMGMVMGLFMMAGLVSGGGLFVVARRMLVMGCRLLVEFCKGLLAHRMSPWKYRRTRQNAWVPRQHDDSRPACGWPKSKGDIGIHDDEALCLEAVS